MQENTEAAFISAFVKPELRERWLFMLSTPKKREKQLKRLYHSFDFQADTVQRFSGSDEKFLAMLRQKGAGLPVYVISTRPEEDGKLFQFEVSISPYGCVWSYGTICIFVPNRLVVFTNEYDRYVLENKHNG